jgi:hypothetical protein
MNPFQFLTRVFIDFFGITHPTEREERRATWFICSLVGLVAAGIVLICFVLFSLSHH